MRVVADNGNVWCTKPVSSFHIENSHAKGTISIKANHFFFRVGKPCRHCKSGSDTERSECSGVHPVPWLTWLHGLSRNGYNVSSIAYVDGVIRKELVDFPSKSIGVYGISIRLEHGHEFFRFLFLLFSEYI